MPIPMDIHLRKSYQLLGRALPPRPHDQGLCPWTPLGALPPDLRYRLALRALAMGLSPQSKMSGYVPALVHCAHTVRPTIMIYSPYGSPMILIFADIRFIPKFEGGHPERGRCMRVG